MKEWCPHKIRPSELSIESLIELIEDKMGDYEVLKDESNDFKVVNGFHKLDNAYEVFKKALKTFEKEAGSH